MTPSIQEERKIQPTVRSTLYFGKNYEIETSALNFTTGEYADKKNPFYSLKIADMQIHVEASRWEEFKEKVKAALDNPAEA
jgi:hypothetical protein